jgi:putative transposase
MASTRSLKRPNCWRWGSSTKKNKQLAIKLSASSLVLNFPSQRIKRRICQTRAEAKSEIFDYIEGFYNRVQRHKHLDQLSPYEFERQPQTAL